MVRRPEDLLPLSSVAFEVLLTLADGDCHGYHIMQAIEERTAGEMTVHPGTLYRTVARLLEQGAVEELPAPPVPEADERRRYYRLTPFGRETAQAEAVRLARQVDSARARRLLGREGR